MTRLPASCKSTSFSEEAIEKIVSLYRKRLAARRKAVPVDDGRLQKQIAALNKQIDQGAERVFSAPAGIVGTLYAKLDRLRAERDRLQGQLNAAGQADLNCSGVLDDEKVEEAVRVLRDMRKAFQEAEPEEIRELVSSLVAKIELHYRPREARQAGAQPVQAWDDLRPSR